MLNLIRLKKQKLLAVKCLDKSSMDEVSLLFSLHQKKTSREVVVVVAVDSEAAVEDSEEAVEDVVAVVAEDADVVVRHQTEVKDQFKSLKVQN